VWREAASDDAHKDWLVFQVQDTGIGIPSNKLTQVFDPFEQADISVTRKYGGTGLGLPISRKLCAMLGGELSAESVLGEGSIFTARLPASAEYADKRLYSDDR
jgi:signal transduction histidine kinase